MKENLKLKFTLVDNSTTVVFTTNRLHAHLSVKSVETEELLCLLKHNILELGGFQPAMVMSCI